MNVPTLFSPRRALLWLSAVAALPALPARATAAEGPPRRPNIVFILADDLGWTDLGCMGSRYYETPAIDRLAREGMKFTDYYNCQNCAPTRAALMTGQYPPRTGIYTVNTLARGPEAARRMTVPENRTQLALEKVTVAQALKGAGYATGMFGKWHLGQAGAYHPSKRGFDEAIVSMGRHYGFTTSPRVEAPPGAYLADFLTDRAVRFIEKNKGRPFFLYLPHFGVHSPYQAKEELIAKYRKKRAAGGHHDPVYAAMIESVDQSVGRVLAKLDELKLAGHTVVIFSSDNGGVGGYAAAGVKARGVTDNAPLRGGKGMLYEGGVRVPFLVRWPGAIRPGTVCGQPALHVDIFPTFLELAGARAPRGQPLDGLSLVPLWKAPGGKLRREAVYAHFPGYLEGSGPGNWRTTPIGTVRAGDFKLLEFFEDGRLELYDLRKDLGEKTNLAAKMPGKAKELHAKMAAWRKDVGAAMPVRKAAPAAAPKAERGPAAEQPNVVMIVADDQGWTDFGFMKHPIIRTPHLDKLAAQSAVFPNGYVPTSLCRASLATLLTGLYPHQHRICCNDPPKGVDRTAMHPFIKSAPALPRLLQMAGYWCLQTGKFWEGHYANAGFTHGETTDKDRHLARGKPQIGRDTMRPIFDFIDRRTGKPFFVWYAPMMPHMPHTPPERILKKYRAPGRDLAVARYYAMCEWLDETVGQLLEHLEKRKLAQKTLVIFVVDNGWIQVTSDKKVAPAVGGPRGKRTPYDGGVRTPVLIRWPGHVKPGRYDDLVTTADLAPTVLTACGVKPPKAMPGLSLLGVAAGKGKLARTTVFGEIYEHTSSNLAKPSVDLCYLWAREGDWKLILDTKRRKPELYNLAKDPFEKDDRAARERALVARLTKVVEDWYARNGK
jgi:arylsulfatase A-like enzyme